MKEPPADLDRCLAILLLRTADRSQDMVTSILHCHKSVVGNVERWFTNTEELSYSEAAKLCSDVAIKRMINIELVPCEEVDKKLLEKVVQITGDNILRHYRADYIERRDPILQKYRMEWHEQLNCPPPQLVLIDSLGRTGEDNSIALRQGILNIALEDLRFNVRVTQTILHANYAHTGGSIFWELPLDTSVKLLCPVERQPRFQELLALLTAGDRQSLGSWKSLGGRFLVACMRVRRTIHDETKARAGGLVTADSIFEKIRSNLRLPPGPRPPSYLTPEFGDLIYQLSIKCRRSPNILQLIEGLYDIRQTGLFCDLIFGHGEPLASGLRGEVERWIDLHQSMIKEFAQSEVISQLIELHEEILGLEAKLKMALDKIIAEEP